MISSPSGEEVRDTNGRWCDHSPRSQCRSSRGAMETELEAMMVGGWVKGDRAKLFLRVEALERELSLMASGRQLEREAFETQRVMFARRIAETDEELSGVVKELSLKASGEEKLRRICQRRVQELEGEAMLLGEQLKIAEAKFRETENALRRERASKLSRRRSLDCFEECGKAPALADRARRVGRDRCIAADSNPFNPPLASTPCTGVPCTGGSHRWDGPDWDRPDCQGDDGENRLKDDLTEEAGELRVVETLIAGLLEENAQLGSTVKQLQSGSSRVWPPGVGGQHYGQNDTALREAGKLKLAAATTTTTTVDTTQQGDAAMWAPEAAGGAVPSLNPIITVAPIESRKCRDLRKGGVGRGGSDAKLEEGTHTMVEGGNGDMANALAKIRALTGMTRVQEEIEKLLGQELCELKKTAKERERLWRLLIRWKGILEARGYAVGHDIRSAGLLKQLRERLTETRRRQDLRPK